MPEMPAPTMMTSNWSGCCGVTVIVDLAWKTIAASQTTLREMARNFAVALGSRNRQGCAYLPIVDELQRHVQVGVAQQRLHGLQIVTLLAADADLVALDLGLDVLGALVADELGDLLGVLAADALPEGAADLVGL